MSTIRAWRVAGRAGRALSLASAAATGYVYVGYPVALALASRVRRPERRGDFDGSVSLVISAHNESRDIAGKLANTAELDYPADRLEVIVADDGSTDGTADIAERVAPWARVLRAERRGGKVTAMARGVAAARGDVVVFSDAHNLYERGTLRHLLAPLADPRVGAVNGAHVVAGGDESVSTGERLYWRYESFIKARESRLGCVTSILGSVLAVRRELIPPIPPGIVNDDFYLGMQVARQGYRVAYVPEARSFEASARSLADDATRRRRMTAGRWQSLAQWRQYLPLNRPLVMWQVVSHKYLRLLLPVTMAGTLAGNALDVAARARTGRPAGAAAAALAGQVAFYGLGAVAGRLPRSLGPVRAVAVLARYLVRSNAASWHGLTQFLSSREDLALWTIVDRRPDAPADRDVELVGAR